MIIRSAYSARQRVAVSFPAVGRAKQSFKKECDINEILKRYRKTGLINHVNDNAGRYMDVPASSFLEAMLTVRKAEEMFGSLPAKVRKRFDNNPASFLEFVQDEKNLPEMRELGLAKAVVKALEEPRADGKPAMPAIVEPKAPAQ